VCIGCNGRDGEPRIAVGGDGTIDAPLTGQSGEYGVGALASDGSCRVVTFSDRDREIDLGTAHSARAHPFSADVGMPSRSGATM